MLGHFRAALMSVSVLTLWGCSTAPSGPPKELVIRDVTAVCPAASVSIDRGFAVQPPACTATLGAFRYEDDATWIGLTEQSVREMVWRGRCLAETQEWIASERAARGEGPVS